MMTPFLMKAFFATACKETTLPTITINFCLRRGDNIFL